MARTKGSFQLAGALEPLAAAALDARATVATKADLTASGSFPYFYIGMETYVVAENKKYRLIGDDPTVLANWVDTSSGGSIDSLNDISDVSVSSEQAGDALVYDETNSGWTNQQVVLVSEKGAANGVAELDSSGLVPSSQLPSYVDDVKEGFYVDGTHFYEEAIVEGYLHDGAFYEDAEYTTEITPTEDRTIYKDIPSSDLYAWNGTAYVTGTLTPIVGETDKIYVDFVTSKSYRWSGSAFVEIKSGKVYRAGTGIIIDDDLISVDTMSEGEMDDVVPDLPEPAETELSDLADVDITTPADGQILKYDANSGKWINENNTVSVAELGDIEDVDLENLEDGQTIIWDATNQKWVNGAGGGSGDASLESAVTSNLAVGAIASGTTLAQGTTFTQFVQKLLITEIAPTLTFSISKSGNVVYGGSYTETLTVACTNLGSAKKIKSIAWYEGSTLKQTDTVDSSTTGSWTYTMGTATTDTTTFKAIITYTKSNDADETSTKTASINFYYNKFYGGVSDLNPSEATVEALTTALGTGKGGTYSFTVTAGRICYAYPKSLGALTSIKDGNGFSLFDSFTRTEQTYTQNGTSVAYYRYVLTDAATVASYSVVFA